MTTPGPIAGNQNFHPIVNLAGFLSNISTDEASIANNLYLGGHNNGQMPVRTLIGYAPTSFGTGTLGTFPINNAPNLPQATALTDPQLLHFPQGALLLEVTATNNDTTITSVGVPLLDLGHLSGAAFPLVGTPDQGLDGTDLITNVNAGVAASGCAGVTCLGGVGSIGAGPNEVVAIEVTVAAVATGDLKVTLTYQQVPNGPTDQIGYSSVVPPGA